jgi:hypothetical protein
MHIRQLWQQLQLVSYFTSLLQILNGPMNHGASLPHTLK